METLEELKAIRDNAPDGSTLVDILVNGYLGYMYYCDDSDIGEKIRKCENHEDAHVEFSDGNIRLLSDINRIIELTEENNALKAKIKSALSVNGPEDSDCLYDIMCILNE